MKRALRWIARIVGGLIVLIFVALWLALSSESVARWAVGFGLKHAPAGLTIGTVRGRLRGPLHLTAVSYRSAAMSVTIDSVDLKWRPSRLLLRQLQLDQLHVTGVRVTLPDSAPADTSAHSPRTRPNLPLDLRLGDVQVRDVSVRRGGDMTLQLDSMRMSGSSAAFAFQASARVDAPTIHHASLSMHGSGSLEAITLDSSRTTTLDGDIYLRGTVGWWPSVNWDVSARAVEIRPGSLMADSTAWPGSVSAHVRSKGVLDSLGTHGTVAIDSLTGAIRRQSVAGNAVVQLTPGVYRLDTLALAWGSVTLGASGTVGDTLNVRYHVAATDLRTVNATVSGSFDLHGTAAGTRAQPHVQADGAARRIAMGNNRAERATLHADVDLVRGGKLALALHIDSASISNQHVSVVALDVSGTRDQHRVSGRITSSRGNVALSARGGYDGIRWLGSIDTLDIDSTTAGRWRLQQRSPLVVSALATRLGAMCLASYDSAGHRDSTGARACVSGAKQPNRWNASVDLAAVPLNWLPVAASRIDSVIGTINVQAKLSAVGERVTGTARLATRNGAVAYHEPDVKKPRRIALDSANVVASIGAAGLTTTIGVRMTDDNSHELMTLTGHVSMPGATGFGTVMSRSSIDATVEGTAGSIAFIRPFLTGVDSLAGAATLRATVTGTVDAPHIDGALHLQKVAAALPSQRAVAGSLDLTVNATPRHGHGADDKIELVPHDVRYSYRQAGKDHWLAIGGNGLTFTTDAQGGRGALDLSVDSDRGSRVAVAAGTVEFPQYAGAVPLGRQPVTAKLNISVDDLDVMQLFTTQADSLAGRAALAVALQGRLDAPTITATATVDSLRAKLSFGTMLRGHMASSLQLAVGADSVPRGKFTIDPSALTFDYMTGGVQRRVSLDSSSVDASAGSDGVKASLALFFVESGAALGSLRGTVQLPHYARVGRPVGRESIEGSVDGEFADLRFIKAFTPLVDSAAGNVTLAAQISGTAADSRMTGSFAAHQVAVRLPRLGTLVDQVELTASGDEGGTVAVKASMHSGSGTLTIAGSSPLNPTAAQPGRVHIAGKDFEAANSAQLRAILSPVIDVTLTSETMQVRGQVDVPIARLVLADIPPTAIAPTDDVVFTDSVSTQRKGPRLDTDVRVVLGDSVSFSGFNFDARLQGALRIMQQPGQIATASGGVVIDSGTYKAYGQDLTISQGKIQFAGGAIDNPALDIRATRTADTVVAGLAIKGTLKTPDVQVFSDPSMSQTEAFSYIVTGHAAGQSGGSSGNLISKGLSALGLKGGNAVAGALGHQLHLDEARIQTEGDIKKASFVAGAYLSPNLYVSYGIGLFDPVSTLRLRYMVSNRFTLQAETGKSTSADVLIKTSNEE